MQQATLRRNFDWYLTNTLAIITGLLICIALVFDVLVLFIGDAFMREPPAQQMISSIGVAGIVVVISIFWFWGRMLSDYFRNRPQKHPVAWGWALFWLSVCAALAYFWFVWHPRNKLIRRHDA